MSHQYAVIGSHQHHPNLPSEGVCHVNQIPYLFQGTMPEPSTAHIGQGVALPLFRVYIRPTLSSRLNDHLFRDTFEATCSKNATLRKETKEQRELLKIRKNRSSGKRVALKGRFVFSP